MDRFQDKRTRATESFGLVLRNKEVSNPGVKEILALLDALKNAIRDFAAREAKLLGESHAQAAGAAKLSDEAAVKRSEKLSGGVDAENAALRRENSGASPTLTSARAASAMPAPPSANG